MTEPQQTNEQQPDPAMGEPKEAHKIICSQELFAGEREICIEHDGEMYRLRITRRNKLILQK